MHHPSNSFDYDPHLPSDVFNIQRANFHSVKDAFCQTSDRETTPTRKAAVANDEQPIKRTYEQRRATDSLLHATGQPGKEANPLMVSVQSARSAALSSTQIDNSAFRYRSALAAVIRNAIKMFCHQTGHRRKQRERNHHGLFTLTFIAPVQMPKRMTILRTSPARRRCRTVTTI